MKAKTKWFPKGSCGYYGQAPGGKENQKRPTPKVWICDIHNISPTMLGHT